MLTCCNVASDGVNVDVFAVNLEIDPINGKALSEAKDRFPKERVDAERGRALI